MSMRFMHCTRGRSRNSTSKKWVRLRYMLPLWIVAALIGFWLTRTDVQNVAPPSERFAGQLLQGDETDKNEPERGQRGTEHVGIEAPQPKDSSPKASADDAGEAEPDSGRLSSQEENALIDTLEGTERVSRYVRLSISREEYRELASVVLLESSNQCMDGQQAVAEVVLNRMLAGNFPDSVHEVLYDGIGTSMLQFITAPYIAGAEPTATQYEAVRLALGGPSVLPTDVVYFSRGGENDYVWGTIQDHIFCYQYPWNLVEDKVEAATMEAK